ncbi:MAG: flavin reductase family protein [Gemmataceae bacterium]
MNDIPESLAAALGRIPSGLFILTIKKDEQQTGMLASWVQQCSFEPPQATVAVKKDRFVADWLTEGRRVTLNIVGAGNKKLVSHFGKGFGPEEDAFVGLDLAAVEASAPVPLEALGYLDGRIVGSFTPGDHILFVVEFQNGGLLMEDQPAVHVRKNGLNY